MKIKCLIIDDEPLAINVLKNFIQQLDDLEITNTFNNAIDALNFLKKESVDIIFFRYQHAFIRRLKFY